MTGSSFYRNSSYQATDRFSETGGIISSSTLNISLVTLSFFSKGLHEFIGLIFIWAHVSFISFNVYFASMLVFHENSLCLLPFRLWMLWLSDCLTPTFIHGSLLIIFVDFIIKLIAVENVITDIVKYVTIPTSRRCHNVVHPDWWTLTIACQSFSWESSVFCLFKASLWCTLI